MSTDLVAHTPAPLAMTLPEKLRWAGELAKADMLPKAYAAKPANMLLAIEYGEMLAVHPLTAVMQVHVIDGKPSQSAELMRAMVLSRGHKFRSKTNSSKSWVQIVRADDPDYPTEVEFTIEDANTAGLRDIWWERWTKNEEGRNRKVTWVAPSSMPPRPSPKELEDAGAPEWVRKQGPDQARRRDPWWQYPQAMLFARATSAAVRAACPEVLMGISYTAEELGAQVDEDGNVLDVAEVRGVGPDQHLADDTLMGGLDTRIKNLPVSVADVVRQKWKAERLPRLDARILTVGQVAMVHAWIDALEDEAPAPAAPGETSSDGGAGELARDPEQAEGTDGPGDVDTREGGSTSVPEADDRIIDAVLVEDDEPVYSRDDFDRLLESASVRSNKVLVKARTLAESLKEELPQSIDAIQPGVLLDALVAWLKDGAR
jgi:hypothetical protein